MADDEIARAAQFKRRFEHLRNFRLEQIVDDDLRLLERVGCVEALQADPIHFFRRENRSRNLRQPEARFTGNPAVVLIQDVGRAKMDLVAGPL